MSTDLHESATIVPADIASCGTTARMSVPNMARR